MLKIPANIENISSRKDNTWKLTIGTQELHPEDEAEMVKLKGQIGHFVFAVSENITEKSIPTEKIERNEKSSSQRLRAVLFRQWEQLNTGDKPKPDFEFFYRVKMERIIEKIKEELN